MRQELLYHANRPAQIDFNLSSDVFEASGFVVNIDLAHDAGVVDQNVELRKLLGDLVVSAQVSLRDLNPAPFSAIVPSRLRRSRVDLASRSRRVTIKTSPLLGPHQARKSSCLRSDRAPLIFS